MRGEQHPDDAGKRRRQRRDDHERVAPGLEVDHDQKIDQDNGAEEAEQQSGKRAVHGPNLTEQNNLSSLRYVFCGGIDDFLNVGRDRAEIAALRGAVDLHHRHDIVLRINRGCRDALDMGNRAERLGRHACRRDGKILQGVQ